MHKDLVNHETVTAIAKAIARCDFRVTISRYITHDGEPWVITVSHGDEYGNVIVEQTNEDGKEAVLGILPQQKNTLITNVSTYKVVRRVTLTELVADTFVGVRVALMRSPVAV